MKRIVRNLESNTKLSIYDLQIMKKKYESVFTRWPLDAVLSQFFLCQLVIDTVIRQLSFVTLCARHYMKLQSMTIHIYNGRVGNTYARFCKVKNVNKRNPSKLTTCLKTLK